MKVLFDQDVPRKLIRYLQGHEIRTVVSMEWGGIKNGELLTLIEQERFEVFLTGDKNMENQQRLGGRKFAVLVISAINWPVIRPHAETIRAAIDAARAGSVSMIDCGVFMAGSKRSSGEGETER